jgi:hypothetical protein
MTRNDVRRSSDGEEPDPLHPAAVPVSSIEARLGEARGVAATEPDDGEDAQVAAVLASSSRVIWIALVDDGRVSCRAH